MNTKSVREKLMMTLNAPEDDKKYKLFIEDYIMLLDEMKINTDTANLAIEAVSIDQGINFLETFIALDKKKAVEAWKIIKNCEGFRNNKDNNALKLMCSFATSGLNKEKNTESNLGNILSAVISLIKVSKIDDVSPEIFKIIKEYIWEMLPSNPNFGGWEKIKMTPDRIQFFCVIIEKMIETLIDGSKLDPKTLAVKKWISEGRQYAEEKNILKEIERNKPPKKSTELLDLAKHFKLLEEELDKSIYEVTRLTLQVNSLQEKLLNAEMMINEDKKKIENLQIDNEKWKIKVNQANQEVDERKKLNEAQIQYREETQASLLQDIARALKPEYGDYDETKDMPMNEMLGEIYREKLKHIFRILEQKGIKVGN